MDIYGYIRIDIWILPWAHGRIHIFIHMAGSRWHWSLFLSKRGGSKWGEYLSFFSRRGAEGTSENPFSKQCSQHFQNLMDASRPLCCYFFWQARMVQASQKKTHTSVGMDMFIYLNSSFLFIWIYNVYSPCVKWSLPRVCLARPHTLTINLL